MPSETAAWKDGDAGIGQVVRNHAQAGLACDFVVPITTTFKVLHVFVVLEVGTRRVLHWNVAVRQTAIVFRSADGFVDGDFGRLHHAYRFEPAA